VSASSDDSAVDQVEDLFARVPGHLLAQMRVRDVVDPEAEWAMEMDVVPIVQNTHGSLQGGIAATLVDMVAGRVILRRLGGPVARRIATIDLHIRYLRTSHVGPARALARILRFGRRVVVVQVDIVDVGDNRRHMATATVAFAILDPAGDGSVDTTTGDPLEELPG
jgi:uncharacterized protein (TIGR00369 family)